MHKNIVMIIGCLLIMSPVTRAQQDNSLFKQAQKNHTEALVRSNVPKGVKKLEGTEQILYKKSPSAYESNWCSVTVPEAKNYKIHDLITIVVNESSMSSSVSESKTERETDIDISFDSILEFINFRPHADPRTGATPELKGTFVRDFDGSGEANRTDMLRARIQATVVDVMPNGTLVIEAQKKIVTDADATTVTLTGVCSSVDVSVGNVIDSSLIANLVVEKKHSGITRDATKRGFLTKLWDAISLF